jgi:hypothetical protein
VNRAILRERIVALIERSAGTHRTAERAGLAEERDVLLQDIAAYQGDVVAPYAKLVGAQRQQLFDAWPPALPTEVFRHVRVAAHSPEDDVRVFRTSGTTTGARGEHFFRDLDLYDLAARTSAETLLFAGAPERGVRLVILAPDEAQAPDSSLTYMLARFTEWFGASATWVWPLEAEPLAAALAEAEANDEPAAVLGTSFAFVHAEDALERSFALPPCSLLMQTGGFKGRSREVSPEALRADLAARYGLPESRVVGEYGMTELSSQLYETTLVDPGGRRLYCPPPWVRVTAVDPERLEPLPEGERGLLRIDDVANLDSVACLQTADSATIHPGELVELHGRHPGALPRGCSLAIEEALAKR